MKDKNNNKQKLEEEAKQVYSKFNEKSIYIIRQIPSSDTRKYPKPSITRLSNSSKPLPEIQ